MVSDFTACKIVVSVFLPAANGRGMGDAHPQNGNLPKLHYMMDDIVCVYDRLKWTWLQLKHMDTVNTIHFDKASIKKFHYKLLHEYFTVYRKK